MNDWKKKLKATMTNPARHHQREFHTNTKRDLNIQSFIYQINYDKTESGKNNQQNSNLLILFRYKAFKNIILPVISCISP